MRTALRHRTKSKHILGNKPGAPVGNLSLEFDKDGKLWFDTMHQGAIGTIDPKTGEIKYYPLPPEWNDNHVQLNFLPRRKNAKC